MGAGNSTPQTARIENPTRVVVPIQITPSVVTRLEEQQKLQQQQCNCDNENEELKKDTKAEEQEMQGPQTHSKQSEQNPFIKNDIDSEDHELQGPQTYFKESSQIPFINRDSAQGTPHHYWPQTNENAAAEEQQFNATLDKLEQIIGKPLTWDENVEMNIIGLRRDLIQCYQDHPGQTLYCSDAAKKYQDFIYREQHRQIEEFNSTEPHEEIEPSPPLPHHHTPPYK